MFAADVEVAVACSTIDAQSYWDSRSSLSDQLKRSKELFSEMNEVERDVVVERVKAAIEAMHDNVEEWLPYSFEMDDGDLLSLSFKILKTQIAAEVERKQLVTSFRLREASKELQEIMLELDEEDETINGESQGRSN
jgi:hypothetical protein